MSVSAALILTLLVAHKPWADRDVPNAIREEQLRPVAEAIAEVSHDREEAAILLALAWHESNFELAVVRDDCAAISPSACDHGRAKGVWQEHRAACPKAWELPGESPASIRAQAACAIAQFRFHRARCRAHSLTPMIGAFSGFATGSKCHWDGAGARVLTVRRFAAELARLDSHPRSRVAKAEE